MPKTTSIEHESYQDVIARWKTDMDQRQNKAIEKLKEIAPKYVKNGFKVIHVSYSGCGDSGEVTEVYATKGWEINDDTHYFNYKDSVYKEISNIVYDLLTYDWYNNDGGGGTVDINFDTGEVGIDAYYVIEEHAKSEEQTPYLKF
tara:strand:- start:27 stop:461 length:435 start_codon:yes stop_codon:yes gene_type:complete